MTFSTSRLAALVAASCFAAGLNVYATVATLGLLARAHAIELPASLDLLTSWWVIGASVTLFAVEFVADKIPAIDLVWNALQTFVRIPVAALLAYAATARLSPAEQLLATVLGSGIAFVAHGGKTAARIAVTPSPEPLSNFALSGGEDVLAGTRRAIAIVPSVRCWTRWGSGYKLLIPLDGEMAEWLKAHAWKTIPASCIE